MRAMMRAVMRARGLQLENRVPATLSVEGLWPDLAPGNGSPALATGAQTQNGPQNPDCVWTTHLFFSF
jgi:hypothetical protein